MNTNAGASTELLYPELSYTIAGILFRVHNEVGGFGREKQYGDLFEILLQESKIAYRRECAIGSSGNIVDFIADDKVVVELKAKRVLVKEDFIQVQRYLQETHLRLGLLVNFRAKYLKPLRIVKIDAERYRY